MKARLIRDANRLLLLCNDGTIAAVDRLVLYDLLTNFSRTDEYFTGDMGKWTDKSPDISVYPGETLAYITDDYNLVLESFEPFASLLKTDVKLRGYISSSEFAQRHGRSTEIIKVYCRQGRIPGATKVGRGWLIPENAEYPIEPMRQKPGSGNRSKEDLS